MLALTVSVVHPVDLVYVHITWFELLILLVSFLVSGPGDLREELRLQVSHPGDDTGFRRGGSGAVNHP